MNVIDRRFRKTDGSKPGTVDSRLRVVPASEKVLLLYLVVEIAERTARLESGVPKNVFEAGLRVEGDELVPRATRDVSPFLISP